MRSSFKWLTLAAGLITAPAHSAEVADIEDLLEARWFEVEMIIFERLPVLDVNSSEALTLNTPRRWPHNLMEMAAFNNGEPPPAPNLDTPLSPLDPAPPFCLGFADDDALQLRLTEAEANPDADEEIAEIEPALAELEQLPPLSSPELTPTPYMELLADVAEFEAQLFATSYQWLPDRTMGDMVKAINRQNHLRPLLHRRWRQPVPPRDAPQPIYVATPVDERSPLTQAGFAKLEGYVQVTVGRYLHFAPTLWYHADTLGLAPVAFTGADGVAQNLPKPDALLHMALNESRRLRSGDMHYLDHPKFGVIVRIDPITIPEPLEQARAALGESAEQGQ